MYSLLIINAVKLKVALYISHKDKKSKVIADVKRDINLADSRQTFQGTVPTSHNELISEVTKVNMFIHDQRLPTCKLVIWQYFCKQLSEIELTGFFFFKELHGNWF